MDYPIIIINLDNEGKILDVTSNTHAKMFTTKVNAPGSTTNLPDPEVLSRDELKEQFPATYLPFDALDDLYGAVITGTSAGKPTIAKMDDNPQSPPTDLAAVRSVLNGASKGCPVAIGTLEGIKNNDEAAYREMLDWALFG